MFSRDDRESDDQSEFDTEEASQEDPEAGDGSETNDVSGVRSWVAQILEPLEELKESYLPEYAIRELPSHGIAYPNNWEIRLHPYTYGEVLKANESDMNLLSEYKIMADGIRLNFSLKHLVLYDFYMLALFRKINSVGADSFATQFVCPNPECGVTNSIEVMINEISFDDIQAEELPVIAKFNTLNDREIAFWPITLGRYTELIKRGTHADAVAIQAASVVEFDGEPLSLEDISEQTGLWKKVYSFLNEIVDPVDIEVVEYIDNEILDCGVIPLNKTCYNCNTEVRVSMDSIDTHVFPLHGSNVDARRRIRFG